MDVTCINDNRVKKELTKGKVYNAIRVNTTNPGTKIETTKYLVKNNLGEEKWYIVDRFHPSGRVMETPDGPKFIPHGGNTGISTKI